MEDANLSEKPEGCDISRFCLLLGRFRHWHRHMGIIDGFIVADEGKWPYVLNMNGKYRMEFDYFAPSGNSHRSMEPYFLIFHWSNWYIWRWCESKDNYLLFKLNRMDQIKVREEHFTKRSLPVPDLSNEHIFLGDIKVKALFTPDCKWRLVEEFGMDSFEEQQDGRLLFQTDYTDKENLLSWVMTFREKVILLQPQKIRKEIREILKKMQDNYDEELVNQEVR